MIKPWHCVVTTLFYIVTVILINHNEYLAVSDLSLFRLIY